MTKLHDRAATALDNTHFSTKGIHYVKVRDYVAAWLDGAKFKQSFILSCVKYLEKCC